MEDQHATDVYLLFTDGGSRGNPGPAAAGVVLADGAGRTVHAAGYFLGKATNNVAEYQGLLRGLSQAVEMGIRSIEVRSDSELMVRQIQGRYKVKNAGLKPLHAQALELIEEFESFAIAHVRREHNVQADQLANDAMDRKASVGDACGDADMPEWPPDAFTAVCTADGCDGCPAVVSAGGEWVFDGATPPGLCLHAAAGILAAVVASPAGTAKVTARCVKPGCRASFDVKLLA